MLVNSLVILILTSLLIRFYLRSRITLCSSKETMTGKVVIVTGASEGIGLEIARDLAKRGARVILASRSAHRGTGAAASIANDTKNNDVIFKLLDLASLQSIRSFCLDILKTEKRLDVLVNNAAGICLGNLYSNDGIVQEMQVNYFGPFLLTMLLLPLLNKSRPSRIVMISSSAAYDGEFDPNNINRQRYYSDYKTYANSKLCDLMFCIEFTRRFKGVGVVANGVHPGTIDTNISKNAPILPKIAFKIYCWFHSRSPTDGAQAPIYLAVAKECETPSGKFFADCKEWPLPREAAVEEKAKILWELSKKMVGLREREE